MTQIALILKSSVDSLTKAVHSLLNYEDVFNLLKEQDHLGTFL
jgi:hypothetical protein